MEVEAEIRETQAIKAVNERLSHTFADRYPGDTVIRTVSQIHHRFDGRPIRDFVPVLVER